MEGMSELALPLQPPDEAANQERAAAEPGPTTRPAITTPEGSEPVRWHVVAKQAGLIQATIVAGRLQAAGIPARAWQEGAGQAIGLTVGLLGTGYVAVPEEYAEQAEAILDEDLLDEDNLSEDILAGDVLAEDVLAEDVLAESYPAEALEDPE
jgi:hypothetical protein